MVLDQLLLSGSIHALKRVESAGKVAFEGLGGRDNLLHDLVELAGNVSGVAVEHWGVAVGHLGDARSFREWKIIRVATIIHLDKCSSDTE